MLSALTALIPALMLATGLSVGTVRAAVDMASKVRVELVARIKSASGNVQDILVQDGGVLRSGDGLQLRLESGVKAYVYIIAYGSSNTAILLHPFSARPGDALIQQGQTEVIPESGVFLPLDGREGRETLFTIGSDVPLTDIPELLARIEKHGDDLSAISDMLNAAFPMARRLSFKHIGASPLVGVAPTAARSADPSAEKQNADDSSQQVGGASLLPPASAGWSVSSTQTFGASEATGTPPAAAATPPAGGSSRSASPSSSDTTAAAANAQPDVQASAPAVVQAGSAPGADKSASVSPARRKARDAAGIDEQQFRGILATLPDSGKANVPESIRQPFKEQGVLAAEGSRIRALEGAQIQSGASWPSNDGGARENIQN